MNNHPGRTALKEIVEALDGVTPGPWIRSGVRQRIQADCLMVGRDDFLFIALPCGRTEKEHAGAFVDAAHFARCDPETIRSIASLVAEQDKELERMRDVIADYQDRYCAEVNKDKSNG